MIEFEYSNQHCLLGNLQRLFKIYDICYSQPIFIDFLVDQNYYYNSSKETDSSEKITTPGERSKMAAFISKGDWFTDESWTLTAKHLANKSLFLNHVQDLLSQLEAPDKININQSLYKIVEYTNVYINRQKETFNYCSKTKNQLLYYYKSTEQSPDLPYNIYLLIHFAVHKTLPTQFYYGLKYHADLDEFNRQVTQRYGIVSTNGLRTIKYLAEKQNLVALYEYANILYYGKTPDGVPDYPKAYELLKKAAGLDSELKDSGGYCNPLALWLLAYMTYNYKRRLDLKHIDEKNIIAEIEEMDEQKRLEISIDLAKRSFILNNNASASNLLGIICYLEDFEKIQSYELNSPQEYFNYSAEQDYFFAYNNLATIDFDNIFLDPGNAQKHLDSYIDHLQKASDHYCNWSSNRLGLFYLTGKLTYKKNGETKEYITNYTDRKKARDFFRKACEYELDAASAWAYVNLLINYPDEYDNYKNETLVTEHILHIIRQRNSEALSALKQKLPQLKTIINVCEKELS